MVNHHPEVAHVVAAMRQESKRQEPQNTHTEKEINMGSSDQRQKAIQFLTDKLNGNTEESRTDAVTKLLRLSDSEISRSQVVKATSKKSPAQVLTELTSTDLRDR